MPRIRTAHKFSERHRTGDVLADEQVDFKSLLLSPDVLKGLSSSGFERPSPIQLKAIPLGRCGLDLIAQAKSGTGKTCVFSVIALESVQLDSSKTQDSSEVMIFAAAIAEKEPGKIMSKLAAHLQESLLYLIFDTQVLILAPTREIAVQIKDVITAIGCKMKNLVCHVFIGGLPVDDDKKALRKSCHIAVGTPGRVKYLIENYLLKTESVRLFILDEADKLLEDNFQEQINWVFSSLPSNKQMMAFSATYPEYLAKHLTRYMREPTFVRLNASDPTLQGIQQFYQMVPFHPLPHKTFQEKVTRLLKLLSSLPFQQCLVFSNYQIRAQNLCDTLRQNGWPSVFIAGSQTQIQRLKAMERLKQFKCRVLISTDLTSRGIDCENVNVVVNMDVPRDSETYLHRIGRAGRFGTHGIAVTFVARGDEEKLFRRIEENIGITTEALPDIIPPSISSAFNGNTELDPTTTLPQAASIEVDILKSDFVQSEVVENQESPPVSQNEVCAPSNEKVLDDVDEKVPVEDQESLSAESMVEKISLSADFESQSDGRTMEKFQTDNDIVFSKDSETEEALNYIQERFQNSLFLGQNCIKKNIGGKNPQSIQTRCISRQLQVNETDAIGEVNFPDMGDVSCNDLKENVSEIKTDLQQSTQFNPSEERPSIADTSGKLEVGKDHSLHLQLELVNNMKDTLNKANHESGLYCSLQGNKDGIVSQSSIEGSSEDKDENVDQEEDEENSVVTQSSDENICNSCSESGGSSNSLEFDASEEEHGLNLVSSMPSVDEFEKDFERYLEHFSGHSQEDYVFDGTPGPSRLLVDDIIEDGIDSSEDFNWHCKTTLAHAGSQNYNTVLETCYQRQPKDVANSCFSHYCGQSAELQNPTANDQFDFQENSFWGPSGYSQCQNDFCDECFQGADHFYNSIYCNNYNPHQLLPGNYYHKPPFTTDTQRQTDFATNTLGQFSLNTGSYQEYQWNASWYNAYQRQTSCIRQFVSFSRSVKL